MNHPRSTLSLAHARAIALAAQHLDRPTKDLEQTLEATGFVRTLGGVDVYLALAARVQGFRAADLEDAVERRDAQVLPSARGCIYLVPRSAAADALALAEHLSAPRIARDHEKVGITKSELDEVGKKVLEALRQGPLTTQDLRRELPDGVIRSLGEIGKKVGISTTLPPALRELEFARRVDRQVERRLDSERYSWRLASDESKPQGSLEEVHQRIAERFLRAAGLATRKSFAAWSGLKQGEAKAALAAHDTLETKVEGSEESYYLLASREAWLDQPPTQDAIALLPFEDNLIALQEGPAFWVDAEHHGQPVPVWGRGKGTTLGDARHAALRPIFAEERMVGFWEWNPDATSEDDLVRTGIFAAIGQETRRRIEERAHEVGRFLRDQLGHGRSFSLDTENAQRQRLELLRQLS